MNIKNINRAAEIAKQLPDLELGRSFLSNAQTDILLSKDGERIHLPHSINMNVLAIINAEINRLKKEIEEL